MSTIKDALTRYDDAVKELIKNNSEDKEEIEASLKLVLEDKWKMSDEKISDFEDSY